jgi:hypothetical protein
MKDYYGAVNQKTIFSLTFYDANDENEVKKI